MGEQARTGQTARNRSAWRGRLDDRPASAACQFWANMTHNVEAARLVVKDLRDVLADLTQAVAARPAHTTTFGRVHHGAPRQVRGPSARIGSCLALRFLRASCIELTLDCCCSLPPASDTSL